MNESQDNIKQGLITNIKDSFAKIYESLVSKLNDLF